MSDRSPDKQNGMMRLRVRNSLRLWHIESTMANGQSALTTGAFQTGFAVNVLKCNNFGIGILASIPSFVGLLQLLAPYLKANLKSRKVFVCVTALVSRLMWLPMLLIPYLLPLGPNHDRHLWIFAFLVLSLINSALIAAPNALWVDWISDLVPADARGRYFGMRNLYGGLTGMVVSIVGALWLDHVTRQPHHQREAFAILFGCSMVFAVGSFLCGWNSPDFSSGEKQPPVGNLFKLFRKPFDDPRFRDLIGFALITTFSQTVAGQFFLVYMLKNLRLTYTAIQVLGAVGSLTTFFSMPLWGYLEDKYGHKPILVISSILVLSAPFMWCMTVRDPYPGLFSIGDTGNIDVSTSKLIIIALNVTSGLGWSGIALATFNMIIGIAPATERPTYVATSSALAGVVGAVGPLIGGAILVYADRHWVFPTTGLVRCDYHFLFVISGITRFIMLLSATKMRDPEARSTRYVLGQITTASPISSFTAIQRLEKASSSKGRKRAAADLGRLKTPVAVEELVKALDDVSLPVREQAAASLGEIGDSRAVASLVTKLTDPGSGIANLAALALGKIGDRSALPALAAAVQLEGPQARRLSAIEALGLLPDPRPVGILLPVVSDRDPALRAAAVRALMSREGVVSRADVTAQLVAQWETEQDPSALSVLADALSDTNRPELAPVLMEGYDRLVSPIMRREALNTIGSLLAGRDAFYAYLVLDRDAREETVRKILTGQQRIYRRPYPDGHPRVSARLRQALEAYMLGNNQLAAIRIGQAAKLLYFSEAHRFDQPAAEPSFGVVSALRRRAEKGDPMSAEEVLLMVFLLRFLIGR